MVNSSEHVGSAEDAAFSIDVDGLRSSLTL
jgi:hypothetical protein